MLSRYRIVRGKRPTSDPLPVGDRIDTRKHTRSVLRPTAEMVAELLADVDVQWPHFEAAYFALLAERWAADASLFDDVARRARDGDVFLGCNCPTKKQPTVARCHTVLALQFMQRHYPDLDVRMPPRISCGR